MPLTLDRIVALRTSCTVGYRATLSAPNESTTDALSLCVELVRDTGRSTESLFVPASLTSVQRHHRAIREAAARIVVCLPPQSWSCPTLGDRVLLDELRRVGLRIAACNYTPGKIAPRALTPRELTHVVLEREQTTGIHVGGQRADDVRLLCDLCHAAGIETLACDVDDPDDWSWLLAVGCTYGSGPCADDAAPREAAETISGR